MVMSDGKTIGPGDLPDFPEAPAGPPAPPGAADLKSAVETVERRLIQSAVDSFGSTRKASEALGISQASVVRKMRRLGIVSGRGPAIRS